MIPYCRNEENKEVYKETKTVIGRRCLTLKNIPQVLDSFLERIEPFKALTSFCVYKNTVKNTETSAWSKIEQIQKKSTLN